MNNYLDQIVEEIKKIDSKDLPENVTDKSSVKILENQKVYVWTRIYLKDEIPDLTEGDDFEIKYLMSNESLISKFICFGKSNLTKDHENQILNYTPENDKKILCLMIDENDLKTRKDIPFIRTLFKTSPFYEHQVIRRDELKFTNLRTSISVEYVGFDF